MKRIAIVLLAFSFVAYPARADVIKGIAGTLATGGISSILCTLTVVYGWGDEDLSSEGFDRRGFFIGAGGAYAGENFSDKPVRDVGDIFGSGTTAAADDSWSVRGGGGYRCHPRYSVGVSVEYFGGFDTQWTGGDLGTGSDDIDIYAVTADIKGYLLTGRYQPYLLLGGGTLVTDTSVTNPTGSLSFGQPRTRPVTQSRVFADFVLRFGGGIDVYATDHVVVNIGASYLLPAGEVNGVDLFTAGGGIEYRF